MHYQRVWKYGRTELLWKPTTERCGVEHCPKPPRSRHTEWCEMHYMRLRRHGTLERKSRAGAYITDNGYIRLNGQPRHPLGPSVLAHRAVLYDVIGPGEHPCHWCRRAVSWDQTYPRRPGALVVDHVDGNTVNNAVANLVPACAACNLKRARYTPPHGRLRLAQVAPLAGVTPGAVRFWVRTGLLAATRAPDRSWLVDVRVARALLARRRATGTMRDGKRVRLRGRPRPAPAPCATCGLLPSACVFCHAAREGGDVYGEELANDTPDPAAASIMGVSFRCRNSGISIRRKSHHDENCAAAGLGAADGFRGESPRTPGRER
jgi:hypothetical protein